MPSYTLRPNGDSKANWTEDPAGTAFSTLDESVTQPTAPTTGSDRITSATDGSLCVVDCGTTTLAGGETVTAVTVWVYAITPAGRNFTVLLVGSSAMTQPSSLVFPANTTGWQSFTWLGSRTQSEVNAFQMQFQNGTGTGTVEIDAAYLEVTTSTGNSRMLRGM